MKSKQTDIAAFFGGKPKAASQGAPASTSPAAKRKTSTTTTAAAADEANPADPIAPGKLKRLRKVGNDTSPASNSPASAAAAAAKDLEDSDTEQQQQGTGSSGPRTSKALIVDEEQAEAVKIAAAAAEAEESEEELDAAEEESEPESELEPDVEVEAEVEKKGGKKKKAKKAAPVKSPVGKAAKIDGVGTLAIKAAAEHKSFDLSSLVTWEAGKPVPFGFLANTFEAIAEESKRLVITSLLINSFRAVIATTPQDLLPMVYLCTNQVSPAHEGLELGIGDSTLIKALAQATGRKESSIKDEYDTTGDLGVVAASSRATQKTMFPIPPLTVAGVFKAFKEIAATEGAKSQERKKGLIVKLLVGAKQNEAGYVMRALQGKLRIGLAEQTVLTALAHAALLQCENARGGSEALASSLEEGTQILKRVYSECPSYDELIPALLSAPLADLPKTVHFTCGVPVKPMLAKPTTGVSEVLDKFFNQSFTCEYKYDGERAQIHVLEDGTVKIYSRNSEDNTGKYPDIVGMFPAALAPGVKSVVLDAEAVAFDPVTGKILPFQVLSTRARKDVSVDNIKVAVCVYAFDCLYKDGKALLQESLTTRREALYSALTPISGKLEFATAKTSNDIEELSKFLDDSVEAGTEGLIVKTMDDNYEPSRRSSHWLKLKKDYMDGVGDTFDLVPIGAWYGKGKRTGWYGSFLLAVWDADNEEYQTITKIGTGFSEEILKQLYEELSESTIPQAKSYYKYPDTLTPDVWFTPKAVWEVKAADLSISPAHKAAMGLVDEDKGISIRFPRLVRVRDDKGPEDSTSPEQVAEMYKQQAVLQQSQKKTGGDDY